MIFLIIKFVLEMTFVNNFVAKFLGTSPLAAYIGHKTIQCLFCFSNRVIEILKAWLINVVQYLCIDQSCKSFTEFASGNRIIGRLSK